MNNNANHKSTANTSVNHIRTSWLSLFQKKGYTLIEPASLIPKNDPSLLWINSGVSALKEYFNDPSKSPSKNLVNCQRVIRTNDLDRIDAHSYHQTLFEMLGCFSVGGNFKLEVIPLIWKFFTAPEFLNISPSKLFITVLETDSETYQIWQAQENISVANIIPATKTTNFWDMGDGPCGPNTEIYYCFNTASNQDHVSVDDLESKNFIEIINIVFSEFYHRGDEFVPLSQKCVDVGGGLERIALVLQNAKNTFQVDVWQQPIAWLESCYRQNQSADLQRNGWMLYTIADHLRTSIFAICDGATIEHKKQGYILKKLLKRTALFAYILKLKVSDLLQLYDKIVISNSHFYKELFSANAASKRTIGDELARFYLNFEAYAKKIEEYFKANPCREIAAEQVFFWYDTSGFPLELINSFLAERGVTFDQATFGKIMKEHKRKSLDDRRKQKISAFEH